MRIRHEHALVMKTISIGNSDQERKREGLLRCSPVFLVFFKGSLNSIIVANSLVKCQLSINESGANLLIVSFTLVVCILKREDGKRFFSRCH